MMVMAELSAGDVDLMDLYHITDLYTHSNNRQFGWYCSKRVKFFHTRHRALASELITVYRQSAAGDFLSHPSVLGCHYFLPGLRSPSQPKNVTVQPIPSDTAW